MTDPVTAAAAPAADHVSPVGATPAGAPPAWHDDEVPATSTGSALGPHPTLPSRPPMIGREADLAALRDAFAAALGGTGGTVVVGGEAGIGKTRLVAEFLTGLAGLTGLTDAAGAGTLVLHGQCADSGSGPLPYAALTGVLADVLDALGPEGTLEAAGPAADALGTLAPGLVEVRRDVDHGRLPEVLADLVSAVSATRPVVLVLEDLHWSDDVTRTVVARLARSAPRSTLLVVATYRSDDVGRRHPLRTTLAELERSRLAARVELARLDAADAARLVTTLVTTRGRGRELPGPVLGELAERSEGVPFYAEELAAFAGEAMPVSLRDLLLLRYSALSDAAQTFCRTVAAAGPHAPHGLLTAMLGEDGLEDAEDAAREAVEAHVLVADGDGYRFRHALMQEAVDHELLPGEARRLHAACARALEETGRTLADAAAAADHWWRARVPDRALAAAVQVVTSSEPDGATSTAVAAGERALELWDLVPDADRVAGQHRASLLRHVAAALQDAAQVDRGAGLAREAVAEWPADDPAGRAQALSTLAHILGKAGDPASDGLIDEALALLPADDHAGRAPLLRLKARNAMMDARDVEAVAVAGEALAAARAAGDEKNSSLALNMRAMSRINGGDLDGLEELELSGVVAGDDWRAQCHYYTNAADIRLKLGQYAAAESLAETGARLARTLGAGWATRAMLEGNVAEAWIELGRWADAADWYERSVPLIDLSDYSVYLGERWTWLTMWRGDVGAAQSRALAHRATWLRFGRVEEQIRARVAGTLAELALLRDDLDDALDLVSIALEEGSLSSYYRLSVLAVAARVLDRARAAGRPVDVAPYRAALATCASWPTYPTWAAVFAAELGDGSWEAVLAADGPASLRPYALFRDGGSLLATGDRQAARVRLEAAVEAAEAIGCGLVADQARALLDGAGLGRVRGRGGRAPAAERALTERESQVLALVAEGLTNGQIAERLFISRKTASVHVSAILRKLGVASRTEAAVVARSETP
ncbi:ATP-binding protein [Isoptericola sp. NPDC057559]|uniref:ATP-binding protein n=1 Tax=Isoptericola sp. NPDC057559 TaxID=3346168 RepID=UPI00368B55D9